MSKQNNNNQSSDDYVFIKETIKEEKGFFSRLIKKIFVAALCGIVFGGCAALMASLVFLGFKNNIDKISSKYKEVSLDSQKDTETEVSDNDMDEKTSTSEETLDISESDIQDLDYSWANQVKAAVETPRKALVRITASGDDSNLLNNVSMDYGEWDGLIFLKNSEAFYIVTYSEKISDASSFKVTFSNGDAANAELCKKDSRTDIYVFRVANSDLKDETLEEIPAAMLENSFDAQQMDPVVALGCPTGEYDSIISGTLTSITGTIETADEEYRVLATDMVGSDEASGILINMSGEVIGIITHHTEESNDVIRAVEVSQLLPLLEGMANGTDICYLGIYGKTVDENQTAESSVPKGMYVDCVDTDSPAMKAGIQDGDIVYKLNDETISSVNDYAKVLQNLSKGDHVVLELYRTNRYNSYSKIKRNLVVEVK